VPRRKPENAAVGKRRSSSSWQNTSIGNCSQRWREPDSLEELRAEVLGPIPNRSPRALDRENGRQEGG
jgi:hypothetical protein